MTSGLSRMYHDAPIYQGMASLAYGIHAALYIASVSALARLPNSSRFLSFMMALMFSTSTAWIIILIRLQSFSLLVRYRPDDAPALPNGLAGLTAAVARINYMLSDVIVAWRAWVLWPGNRPVRCTLAFALCLLVVSGFSELGYTYSKYGPYSSLAKLPDRTDNYIRAFTGSLLVVLSNLLSTTLVAIKVWQYRRNVKSYLGRSTQTRVEKLLLLLTESGFIYSAVWIVYLGAVFASANTDDGDILSVASGMGTMLPSIEGMYPTLVVLICSLQSSPTHELETMQFEVYTDTDGHTASTSGRSTGRIRAESIGFRVNDVAFCLT
ncbi:hypothetical protein BD626DRAFT_572598 [Schizophyllum amplum]|uniref:Uncharacterized protein n=1 Tax=Schizophyllum amplum TaxID=97359 RepID=A0A550C4E1_9AGAR|nr:hypothetical protein BD626DRAFT_572598 [Auriculariopsis ampla]